jgi:hypothetical protein
LFHLHFIFLRILTALAAAATSKTTKATEPSAGYRWRSGLGLQQLKDALQRHLDPIGPIVQLVSQLINSLVQQVCVQKDQEFFASCGKKITPAGGLEIRPQKG